MDHGHDGIVKINRWRTGVPTPGVVLHFASKMVRITVCTRAAIQYRLARLARERLAGRRSLVTDDGGGKYRDPKSAGCILSRVFQGSLHGRPTVCVDVPDIPSPTMRQSCFPDPVLYCPACGADGSAE